jgi:hypothetical protein
MMYDADYDRALNLWLSFMSEKINY